MELHMCKVFDEGIGDWIDLGVFSTPAKAEGAGTEYIENACEDAEVTLIDWEVDTNVSTHWYQTPGGRVFTRVITKCELDQNL